MLKASENNQMTFISNTEDHGNIELPRNVSLPEVLNGNVRALRKNPRLRKMPSAASSPVKASDNAVLSLLPAAFLQTLLPSLRRTFVRNGQFLVQQDDMLEYVYFPETAVVSEFHILDDGRMIEVSLIGREGAIGLSTMHRSARTPNCVQVTQAGEVIRIESSVLRQLGRRIPELFIMLHSYFEDYVRQISLKAVCSSYHSIEERFCTWLLMLHDRCGDRTLNLTHEQIARTLGVYRASVTCAAIDLRNRAMIDYSRGGISIRDRKLLEKGACPCYFELQSSVSYR